MACVRAGSGRALRVAVPPPGPGRWLRVGSGTASARQVRRDGDGRRPEVDRGGARSEVRGAGAWSGWRCRRGGGLCALRSGSGVRLHEDLPEGDELVPVYEHVVLVRGLLSYPPPLHLADLSGDICHCGGRVSAAPEGDAGEAPDVGGACDGRVMRDLQLSYGLLDVGGEEVGGGARAVGLIAQGPCRGGGGVPQAWEEPATGRAVCAAGGGFSACPLAQRPDECAPSLEQFPHSRPVMQGVANDG